MPNAVIVDACRTPIGTWRGKLSAVRADDLAALCLRGLVARTHLDPGDVEEVILGCANQAGEDNRNVARMALLLAGFPDRVAGITVNRLCSSGLDAVIQAARAIRAGEGDCYIAGGVESMTRAPWVMAKPDSAWSRNPQVWDSSIGWRFPNPEMERRFPLESMGQTAENIAADRPAINRQRQDHFALESHRRAVSATNAGRFKAEIVPVPIPQKRGDPLIVDVDEHPRMALGNDGRYTLTTSLDELSKLTGAFRTTGSVTAGNASGINDGAAAVLVTSEERARALGLRPMARIIASASAGVDPRMMGYGPIPATRKALERAHLRISDLDLIELNEAFAVQALAVMDELNLPHERTNVNGGAIALGHPLGCSGARLVTTLVHEMKRRHHAGVATSPYGLATLCVGVGQGVALVVERV